MEPAGKADWREPVVCCGGIGRASSAGGRRGEQLLSLGLCMVLARVGYAWWLRLLAIVFIFLALLPIRLIGRTWAVGLAGRRASRIRA